MIKCNCGNYSETFLRIIQEKVSQSFKIKMAKFSQKIVLFIEPAMEAWSTPSKIGNLFVNRFAIDEDANHEILKIYQLENFKGLDLID